MRMKKPKVELNKQEWGQVLDGLTCRVALYEETVGYYKHGVSYGHIAEVNGVEEAQAILRYYRRIIRNIKNSWARAATSKQPRICTGTFRNEKRHGNRPRQPAAICEIDPRTESFIADRAKHQESGSQKPG